MGNHTAITLPVKTWVCASLPNTGLCWYQEEPMATTHRSRFNHFHAARPVALALLAAGLATPAAALDYVWLGGSGNWDNGANWSLLGVPGAGDLATINAGTATLSFDRLVGELRMTAGTLTGSGLTISGTATLIGGNQTGTGTSQFNGNVLISGNSSRTLSGGRIMATAGTTTWGGNTSDGGNDLNFSGSASIVNTGTWNDTNSFASSIGSGSLGTKVFTNGGI